MHEREKLKEAQYFMQRLPNLAEDDTAFRYELSAFLSSARSVLQYARDDAKTRPGGLAWYDRKVSADPLLRYLKDKRDLNVHRQPVKPAKHVSIGFTGHIHYHGSFRVEIRRSDGTIEVREDPTESLVQEPDADDSWRETSWYFRDWTGSEDVVSLCSRYLSIVTQLIDEGVQMGMIAG